MLLATKLYLPLPHPDHMVRPRLNQLLDAGLASRLILVAAPAGFGKSSCVSAWLQTLEERQRVAWLSLAEEENEILRYFAYLIAALQQIDATIGQEAQRLLASPQPPPAELLMTLLINDLTAVNQPGILVLDDYHLITDQTIHQAMIFLIEKMPPTLKVVITARADPPFPLARWRVRRMLVEVRTQDLRFLAGEATTFLVEQLGIDLATHDVAALAARTEGWIAGLQLAALSLQGRRDVAGFVQSFTGSHTYIIDYLVEEVLQRQPPAIQHFLLATSILPRFCADLCQAVTGQHNAQALIEEVRRANLFLVALDNERIWYRYHHLFAEVLQHRLGRQDASAAVTYHRLASDWYAAQGFAAEAVDHAFAAGDLALVTQHIERFYDTVAKEGKQSLFALWMAKLPATELLARPVLALGAVNIMLIRYELDQADAWLAQLTDQLDHDSCDPHVRGELLYQKAHAASRRFAFPATIEYGERGLQIIGADDVGLRAKYMLMLGLAYYYVRGMEASLRAFEQATKFALQANDLYIALYGMNNQAEALVKLGRLPQAITLFQSGLALVADRPFTYLTITNRINDGLSLVYYEINNLPAMQACVEQTLAHRTWLNPVRNFENQVALAKLHFAQGDAPLALTTVENALRSYAEQKLPLEGSSQARQLRVYLWLALGMEEQASQWAAQSGLTIHDELATTRQPEYIALARTLLAQGNTAAAQLLLQRLLAATQADNQEGTQVELLALQALAYTQQGDQAAAYSSLAAALRRGQAGGFVRSFITLGEPLRHLLQKYVASQPTNNSGQSTYLAQLLAAFPPSVTTTVAVVAAAPAVATAVLAAPPLVEPLSERELEVLRLVAAGLSNTQIADQLIITVGTVKRHLNNIFGKLAVGSRTQAIAQARTLRLI